jgi:catechol 2,3-dioxygenase-like lactoylglutathione lyase family enzyme
MPIVKPILRIFDYKKTLEFYIDWLGFNIDWEYKEEDTPVYMQVSLGDIVLHLSEHHGDGTPGTRVFIDDFKGLKEFQQALIDKQYKYNRPGIEVPFWDAHALEMTVDDPFGNKLLFVERRVREVPRFLSQTGMPEAGPLQ